MACDIPISFLSLIYSILSFPRDHMASLFDLMDTNADGSIDWSEYKRFMNMMD